MRIDNNVGSLYNTQTQNYEQALNSAAQRENSTNHAVDTIDYGKTVKELNILSQIFNHRIRFAINKDIDRVIVKMIDRKTDAVVKEIPSAALQQIYSRVQEAISRVFDI